MPVQSDTSKAGAEKCDLKILSCILHISDGFWRERIKELAYKNIVIRDEHYILPLKGTDYEKKRKELRLHVGLATNILAISLVNYLKLFGERSPTDIKYQKNMGEVYDKWSSIKSKNKRDVLLLDYAKRNPQFKKSVIEVFKGIQKAKNVTLQNNKITHIDFTPSEDKTTEKVENINTMFKSYLKRFYNLCTFKYKV